MGGGWTLLRLGGCELNIRGEIAQRGVAGEELVDIFEGSERWVSDRVLGEELAIPEIANFEADGFEESFDAFACVEAVVIFIATRASNLLGPGKLGGEIEAEEEAAGTEDASDLGDRGGVIGDMFEDAKAEHDIEGTVVVGELVGVGKGRDLNLEALEDRGLLTEGGIVVILLNLKIAGFEASRPQVANQLADLPLSAAPVEDLELVEGSAEMIFGERFDVIGEVDIGVLPGGILQKTVGGQCGCRGCDLVVEGPVAREDVFTKLNEIKRHIQDCSATPIFQKLYCH